MYRERNFSSWWSLFLAVVISDSYLTLCVAASFLVC